MGIPRTNDRERLDHLRWRFTIGLFVVSVACLAIAVAMPGAWDLLKVYGPDWLRNAETRNGMLASFIIAGVLLGVLGAVGLIGSICSLTDLIDEWTQEASDGSSTTDD